MSRAGRNILAVVLLAGVLRLFFAINLPLSGDEGISLLQAGGQAHTYKNRFPDTVVPVEKIKGFISYSDQFSVKDVISSMRYNGMHPPFYYLVLHYILKYLGNDAFVLRLISILMSLCSVVLIYQLGKTVDNELTGIYSAVFLAISAYGIMYGTIVRPYPLAMLLALISSFQALTLSKTDGLKIENKRLALYAVTVVLGLYTIYHFLFVFIFQLAFLSISNFRNRKSLLKIGIMTLFVAISYLPWIPCFLDQLRVVRSRQYYFSGDFNLETFFRSIVGFNFSAFYMIYKSTHVIVKMVILVIPLALILWGYFYSFREKRLRFFVSAAVIAILACFSADRIMNTNTLNIPKLSFFITPMALIFLAIGISHMKNRRHLRSISLLICCGLLLHGGIKLYNVRPNFDGPPILKTYQNKVRPSLNETQNKLVIVNTSQRRYLFSLAHIIQAPADIKFFDSKNIESETSGIDIENYDLVLMINCYISYSKQEFFSEEETQYISNYLNEYGFSVAGKFPESDRSRMKSRITVFKKTTPALK